MPKAAVACLIGLLAAAGPVRAEEGTAELATGGLLFVHNDDLEMLSAEIAIGSQQISARYRLFNSSDKDVTVLVAFPLPDVHVEGPDDALALPTEEPVNLLACNFMVNGRRIFPEFEQRATALGLERTQLLRALGLPLAPHLATTNDALDRVPPERWDELIRLGVVELEERGEPAFRHLGARWTLHSTYYWEQTFAAGSETMIDHYYRPSVGSSEQTLLGATGAAKDSSFDEYKDKYCLAPEFLAAIERERKVAGARFAAPFAEERIEYVLKTGANGSRPAKDFRLLIDKGAPENLISFCADDARPVSATQLEIRRGDHAPDGTLSILILRRRPL